MVDRLVSVDASTLRLPAAVRVQLGVEVETPGSEIGASVGRVTAALPKSLTGTYAARPAATSVPAGTVYYASNVPEVYRSNGTVWSVVSSGGNELGYAQITSSPTTTSGTAADVAGLTTTFVVGERPIRLQFDGDVKNSIASTPTVMYIVLDGVQRSVPAINGLAADKFITVSKGVRVSGLTAGSTHTAKIQWAVGGGTGTLNAATDNPASLSVVTL